MSGTASPYDGAAAQVVPLPVEKLPLFHWRPGARLLIVGSRDGVGFDDDVAAQDGTSFRRPMTAETLEVAAARSRVAGLAVAYGATLRYPQVARLVREVTKRMRLAFVVATNGYGDADLGVELAGTADACLLAVTSGTEASLERIAAAAHHVEWLVGITGDRLPDVPWTLGAAAHLTAMRMADGIAPDTLAALAAQLPVPAYHEHHQRTVCACGEVLVWRVNGRSRVEGDGRTCPSCGRPWRSEER